MPILFAGTDLKDMIRQINEEMAEIYAWVNANKLSLIVQTILLQDRCGNTEKPSATLDPSIATWFSTLPTNHRPANFWQFQKHFFFQTFHEKCEVV